MSGAQVVVRAVMDGFTICSNESEKAFHFKKDDVGLMGWMPKDSAAKYWEPVVIWDKDAMSLARRVILDHVQIVGLEYFKRRLFVPSAEGS